jgi:hypothetical protein
MAEEDNKTVDSGFVPGRALSQDQYTFGRPDFYKDYLSLSGIDVRDPVDDDDDDDKDDTYTAPRIIPTEGGDSEPTNLLSTQLTTGLRGNVTGVVGNYYDAKVKAADLQSMDLTSKSWQDYKKASGLGDKSTLTRDANITGLGLAVAGTSGAMIGGALLGEGVNTPWGIENTGAGMFTAIGNYAISEKYNATKEVIAAQAAFADPDGSLGVAGEIFAGQDVGNAFYVDDTYLVRRPGSTQYIGTLPSGLTNQQVLNLEAIRNNKLPKLNGIGDEDGFGVGGTGGYKFNGFFVNASGQTSFYGPLAGIEQLAKKDFNGDKKKAEQWLTEVRSYRNIFGSTITKEQAQAIKDRLNAESDDVTTTTTGGRFGKDEQRFRTQPTQPIAELDSVYTGPGSLAMDRMTDELDGVYRGPGSLAMDRTEAAEKETDIIDPGRGASREFMDLPDPRFDPRFGDFGQGTTFADRNRSIQDALTSSYNKAKQDSADRKAAQTYSFSEDDYRDMSEGSQTADEVTVDPTGGQDLSATFADDAASSDTGGDKIVCTMMNQSYGFGSFRNAIWLKYSKDNLSEEYQKGYHRIFLPLVAYAKGTGVSNKIVRNTLEHIAKHRTLDLRQEMRGAKRHTLGRLYRSVLEPICYIVGKV